MTQLELLERKAWQFDFHQAMRRLDCAFRDQPRAGEAHSPKAEPIRLGQDPSHAFAPAPVQRFRAPEAGKPGQLRVAFLGLFGPHGPLPQHFTEHARERANGLGDPAFAAFADLFHHRMLLLFHRAWSVNHPVVCQDRPSTNRFSGYLKALSGLDADPASDPAIPQHARLQFAARFMHPARNAEGLEALVAEYFGVRPNVHEYAAEWLEIPAAQRWKLGSLPGASILGQSTLPGRRFFQRGQKFRLELGPLSAAEYQRYLPGSAGLVKLMELVRSYVGAELSWDLRLVLDPAQRAQLRLGSVGRLGRDAWLSLRSLTQKSDHHIIIDPSAVQPLLAQPSSRKALSPLPSSKAEPW